jgi:hypothetical protein
MTTQLQYGMGGDRPYSLYYRHSGQTPIGAIILAGIGGALAGIVLAFAYAYLDAYCPYGKLRVMGTIFFGMGVGAATAGIAKVGKVRSLAVVLALVAAAAVVAYYFCWVFWIEAAFQRFAARQSVRLPGYADLILSPATFVRCVQLFNENGYWMFSSTDREPPHGLHLTLIWIAEAMAIFGGAMAVAHGMARAQMFCETCKRWCTSPVTVRRTAPGDAARLRQTLEAHDFSYLNSLPPADSPSRFWTLDYEHCPACANVHALSIKNHTLTLDKKGRVKGKKEKAILTRLLLEPDEVAALRNPAPAIVAAVPAVPTQLHDQAPIDVSNKPSAPDAAASPSCNAAPDPDSTARNPTPST